MARMAAMSRRGLIFCLAATWAAAACADGAADNLPESVRRIPAPGIEVPEADRAELEMQLARLKVAMDLLAGSKEPRVAELLPDVAIYYRAVHGALTHQEFFHVRELPAAKQLLDQGLERASQLARGEAPWTTQTGLVVRGYKSRIDGSVQPYGLVIPPRLGAVNGAPCRLDIWFHGRGETLSELNFLVQRQTDRGVFAPPDAMVLHPYGRYCNAFKFAGEIDVLEALDSVRGRYPIDEDRIAVRGFSMGGAACWQFAVHYADRWVAATPGAGFAETPEFLRVFQKETLNPTWWERKLWRLYDCTDYARNLWNCPTIAYSGENDLQKQAADAMAKALLEEGLELVHIIGPGTGHSYHPQSREEIDRRLSQIAARGRDRAPREVHLVTYTLRYNRMHWVTIDALDEHWEKASVAARQVADGALDISTTNVAALTLEFEAGWAPFDPTTPVSISIDGQDVRGPRPGSDRSWRCALVREGQNWARGSPPELPRKRHGLQGPIDDAFMDSFLFVRPTGSARSAVDDWSRSEMEHAIEHWRRQFRGDARVKDDQAVTEEDIAGANLVLWGTPQGNSVLAKIADRLPVAWRATEIAAGDRRYPAAHHALALVAPNPLNPDRYVVLNSGFTYREYDYLNNARQVPKLPDWAIIDVRTPANSRQPGRIVAANFFDEQWRLRAPRD
jgi:pimeloyl-ACP methyl ester carboxylesterase